MGVLDFFNDVAGGVKGLFQGGNTYTPDPANAKIKGGGAIRDALWSGLASSGNRRAPQAGRTSVGAMQHATAAQLEQQQQAQWRAQQQALTNRLTGIASGTIQGAGELATQRAINQALAAQQSMAASQRGGNAALAARGAARNAGAIGTSGAGQAAQAALSDQAAANQQLGAVLQGAREQDIGIAGQNAGLQQQTNLANMSADNQRIYQQAGLDSATSLANMSAKLQQAGMNDQAALAYLAQLYGIGAAEMNARLQQEAIAAGSYQPGIGAGLIQAGGQIGAAAAMSDVRAKTNIRDGANDVDELLRGLRAYSYAYKDEKHGKGQRVGIMAQDMERSRMGRAVVFEEEGYKKLDVNKALSAALAASARLDERLRAIEGKKDR